jgi:hypothetical protein
MRLPDSVVSFLLRLHLHRTLSRLALTNLIGSAEAAISPVDRDQSIGQRDQQMSTQPSEPARIANASPWRRTTLPKHFVQKRGATDQPGKAARLAEIAGKPIVLFNRALPSSRERPICW